MLVKQDFLQEVAWTLLSFGAVSALAPAVTPTAAAVEQGGVVY